MPTIWSSLREAVSTELEKRRNRDFFEAAMAASAWIAMADGDVRLSEQIAFDHVIENVRELSVFDTHKAVDRFKTHVDALRLDREPAEEQIRKVVARLAGNDDAARLLIRLSAVIARADSEFSASEMAVVDELGRALAIEAAEAEREAVAAIAAT